MVNNIGTTTEPLGTPISASWTDDSINPFRLSAVYALIMRT